MKRKSYKLKKTQIYSPIIAVMGKLNDHHTKHMPKDYGTPYRTIDKTSKPNSLGFGRNRKFQNKGVNEYEHQYK